MAKAPAAQLPSDEPGWENGLTCRGVGSAAPAFFHPSAHCWEIQGTLPSLFSSSPASFPAVSSVLASPGHRMHRALCSSLPAHPQQRNPQPGRLRVSGLLAAGTEPSSCSMNIPVCQLCCLETRIKISPGLLLASSGAQCHPAVPKSLCGGMLMLSHQHPQSTGLDGSYLKCAVPSWKSHWKNPRWGCYSLCPYSVCVQNGAFLVPAEGFCCRGQNLSAERLWSESRRS